MHIDEIQLKAHSDRYARQSNARVGLKLLEVWVVERRSVLRRPKRQVFDEGQVFVARMAASSICISRGGDGGGLGGKSSRSCDSVRFGRLVSRPVHLGELL